MSHRTAAELAAALPAIREAPAEAGTLHLVVRRPGVDARVIVDEGLLDVAQGLVGDRWADGNRHRVAMQVTMMGMRAVAALAGPHHAAWLPAGDQLFVDLDLSQENLPAGSWLAAGGAVLEVTAHPHLGCAKFAARYGADALAWVNSDEGRALRLRGLNARVIVPGTVRPGDTVRKLGRAEGVA